MFSKVFALIEERDEIMDSVVNTCTAELEDMLYETPGEPRSIKERSHLEGFKTHQGSGIKWSHEQGQFNKQG